MNNVLGMVKLTEGTAMEAKLIGESDVMLKSTVDQEEHKFFVQHQKQLNKQIFAALAKQKDQIRKIKILIGHTDLEGKVDPHVSSSYWQIWVIEILEFN